MYETKVNVCEELQYKRTTFDIGLVVYFNNRVLICNFYLFLS